MKKMTYNLKLKSLYWLSEEDIENIKSFGVEDLMIIIELMNEAIQYLSETLDIEEIINKK